MLHIMLAAVGGTAIAMGLASKLLRNWPLTEPLAALVVGVVIGPEVAGLVELGPADHATAIGIVALPVLAVSVMSAALRQPLSEVLAVAKPVVLLLVVTLPVMMFTSSALSTLIVGVPAATAAVLGAALAPTDPVMASNAVAGTDAERQIPVRIRCVISLESGSNDGIAFAMVTVAMAVTLHDNAAVEAITSVGIMLGSVAFGTVVGLGTGRLLVLSERHDDIEHTAFLVLTLALVALVLGATEAVGGNGIIAVFAAGIAYGSAIPRGDRESEWLVEEAINQYVVLPAFAIFGVVLPWGEWMDLGWAGLLLAATILALRRLPVVLALRRPLGQTWPETWFIGWTGPIGVASLYLLAHAVQDADLDGRAWAVGTLVIAASIVAHGTTAATSRRRLSKRVGTG